MLVDDNEKLRGLSILIDPYIHKKAKLSKEEFLEKVKHIKYLRTTKHSHYISFYITSQEEYFNLIKFHDLVNKGIFDFKGYYVFAIGIQPKLYNWFKTTNISTIQKQIVCWLAGYYFFQKDKRDILKRQIYKPLFDELTEIVENYYQDFNLPYDDYEQSIDKYLQVCKMIYKTEPPEFLNSPHDYECIKEWGVNGNHNFEFIEAYLKEKDWEKIILGNSDDDMHRAESEEFLWLRWKHTYSMFDFQSNFVYSFYYDSKDDSLKKDKINREVITQDVKDKVWQRDEGKCVQCGSNENLEFDHIIPVSKGGSSTYRNIQLLCEKCNRQKYNRI